MKMKSSRYLISSVILSYFTICALSVGKDGNAGSYIDYLKLTRENLPCPKVIVSAAYNNLDFNLTTFKERVARVHSSALLPESVNFGYGHAPDGLSSYGFSERISEATRDGFFQNSRTNQQHGTMPNEYLNRESLSLSMRWDLQKLFGFDSEELNTLADVINQVDQEGFALNQIARSYGQLIAALPKDASEQIQEAKILIILENAAILDTLSGGLIADKLMEEASAPLDILKSDSETNIKIIDRGTSSYSNTGSVIEVRDGQDDGIEVVGGASN